MNELQVGEGRIELRRGDITATEVDAIVNAANAGLRGGGGVDGAIHAAGGASIMSELMDRYPGGTPTGSAVATAAGRLPARWVIHAVGPVWRGGDQGEADLLTSAYWESLARADELGASSIAFPAISCGIYGYPLDEGARIGLTTVRDHLARGETSIRRAVFVLFSGPTYDAFGEVLATLA